MQFTMDNWTIAPEWVEPMQAIPCFGANFYAFLMDSMLHLVQSFGDDLHLRANLLTNANGPAGGYEFTGDQMYKYLHEADFKFGTGGDRLFISGPDEEMSTKNQNGRTIVGSNSIRINIYGYSNLVQQNFNGWLPFDDTGRYNLKTLIGKVVLHEMMHCEGFSHPDRSLYGAYDPSATYWRTFPEVAEEAYTRFRGGLPDGAFQLIGEPPTFYCGN